MSQPSVSNVAMPSTTQLGPSTGSRNLDWWQATLAFPYLARSTRTLLASSGREVYSLSHLSRLTTRIALPNALEITVAERPLAWKRFSTVWTIILKHSSKTAHFHLKMNHREAPQHGARLIEHRLHRFDCPIAMEEQRPSLTTPT